MLKLADFALLHMFVEKEKYNANRSISFSGACAKETSFDPKQ